MADNSKIDPELLKTFMLLQNLDAEQQIMEQQSQRIEAMRGQKSPQASTVPAALFGGISDIIRQKQYEGKTAESDASRRDLNKQMMEIIQKYFGAQATQPEQQAMQPPQQPPPGGTSMFQPPGSGGLMPMR